MTVGHLVSESVREDKLLSKGGKIAGAGWRRSKLLVRGRKNLEEKRGQETFGRFIGDLERRAPEEKEWRKEARLTPVEPQL